MQWKKEQSWIPSCSAPKYKFQFKCTVICRTGFQTQPHELRPHLHFQTVHDKVMSLWITSILRQKNIHICPPYKEKTKMSLSLPRLTNLKMILVLSSWAKKSDHPANWWIFHLYYKIHPREMLFLKELRKQKSLYLKGQEI